MDRNNKSVKSVACQGLREELENRDLTPKKRIENCSNDGHVYHLPAQEENVTNS